ncbi:putative quinol monooxygenase [Prevotella sp.]|uniref:putative quinol monooxygenase n=1 Tax=Prevotella sp. TaxID=59823 RepID=UPI002F94DEF5
MKKLFLTLLTAMTAFTSPAQCSTSDSMIVRIAEIEVYPEYLNDYLATASKVGSISVKEEPGVVCIFPMQMKDDSTQIRIIEIYRSPAAYQSHLKTNHFLKYKEGTLHMVKSLKLPAMRPLDPDTMKDIFKKK